MTSRFSAFMFSMLLLSAGCRAASWPCHDSVREGEQARSTALQALACQAHSHRLVLLGELHGTVESPALLADLLRAQPAARPIRLGLEWPVGLQSKVDSYFHSSGTSADRAAFAAGRDWSSTYDGRMSRAWLMLIDTVRDLRRQGRDVQVFTMEPNYGSPAQVAAAGGFVRVKEAGMARAIDAQLKLAPPDALVAALVGNYHVRTAPNWPDPTSSLAYRLSADHPLLVLPQSEHGTFWAIVPPHHRASVQTLHGKAAPLPANDVVVQAVPGAPDGVVAYGLLLPTFTASPHP